MSTPGTIRVLLETCSVSESFRGKAVYAASLLSALRELAEPDVDIIAHSSRRLAGRIRHLGLTQWEMPMEARRHGASLVHFTESASALFSPCPRVVTIHDMIPSLYAYLPLRPRLYWKHFVRFSARFAQAVIAVSECTRKDILRFTSVREDRISVVPLGVSDEFCPGDGGTALDRSILGLRLRRPYILAVSPDDPWKNFGILLEAFDSCRRRGALDARWTLAVVGQPQRAGEAPDGPVRYLGPVSREELVTLYQGAEMFVFPSAYEGFGLPPLEAMACGTPVVASAVASIPEVTGDAAWMVPPPLTASRFAEAVASLAGDAAARRELSSKGLARSRLFPWSRTARRTLEIYRRVSTGS